MSTRKELQHVLEYLGQRLSVYLKVFRFVDCPSLHVPNAGAHEASSSIWAGFVDLYIHDRTGLGFQKED